MDAQQLDPPPANQPAIEAHLGKGYEALKQDSYEEAATEFRAALQIDPSLAERARFPLAIALFESHQSAEARQELEKVRREVGDHPNVLYYLGRLDLDERKFDSAAQNLRKAAAKPPFPDTAYYLGFAYFKLDNFPQAEKWLKEAVQLNPHDARALYQLGAVYRKEGREQDAKKALAESAELRHHDEREILLKSECGKKLEQGAQEEARKVCDQLFDPENADKLAALGAIYAQHEDLQAALKPFRRAAELEPQSPQMQYNLALAYFQLNQFEQARAPLQKSLERWPDLFQLNALYGAVLLKLGQEIPGYQALHHARQLNPEDAGTNELLYKILMLLSERARNAGQDANAVQYLGEAAGIRPKDPAPHQMLAKVYEHAGNAELAAAERHTAEQLGEATPH